MSCVWICLTMLCAAIYPLQSSASPEGVSVTCNKTVEVEAGESLTIYCSVNYTISNNCCIVETYLKLNPNRTETYNNSEGLNYVLLNVSNVIKADNWTVKVSTDCGMAKPFAIEIKINIPLTRLDAVKVSDVEVPPERDNTALIILGVFLPAILLLLLVFLFGTGRGRQFLKHIKRKIHRDYRHPPSPDEC